MIIKTKTPTDLTNFAVIPVHPNNAAIIDSDDFDRIAKFKWYITKQHGLPYAARKVNSKNGSYWVRMHREIMHTPKKKIVHHKNRKTLDNRKCNLINLTQAEHIDIHKYPLSGFEARKNEY
jgi:hypothetical protein